jgi:dihydroflavonol-4-reductase
VVSGFCTLEVDVCAVGEVVGAERGRVGVLYIVGNDPIMLRDFYRTVANVAGIKVPDWRIPVPVAESMGWLMEKVADVRKKPPLATFKATRYAAHTHFFDNGKARRELGLPSTPLTTTIEKAVRWFRTHGYA